MNSLDKAKDRIRKLLEVARDDAATQGEIDNALSFAKTMMDAHHLSEEDLATEPADQYAEIEKAPKDRAYSFVGSKIYYWENRLASFVTDFVGGIGYFQRPYVMTARTAQGLVKRDDSGRLIKGRSFCFYGITEDAHLAAELFDELRITVAGMATLKFGGCYKGDGGSYAEGFIDGLRVRLDENEKQERIAATDSRSMVLIERRNDLVERKVELAKDYLKSVGINLVSGSRRSGACGSYDARTEGRQDGQRAQVNRERTKKICG